MKKKIGMVIIMAGVTLYMCFVAVNAGMENENRDNSIAVFAEEKGAEESKVPREAGPFAHRELENVSVSDGDNEIMLLSESVSTGDAVEAENVENEENEESEYATLAIADVNDYVNVRSEPSVDSSVLGKLYDGAVAEILSTAGEQDDWFYVTSGSVTGYIKAEFFIYGDAAAAVVDDYVTRYATIHADRLNVRKEPSTEASRMGYIDNGEKVPLLENLGDWLKIQYTNGKEGYIAAEYANVSEEFVYAISKEEEAIIKAAERERAEREGVSEQSAPESMGNFTPPETTYTSNEELRQSIVDYAMQYLGNVYIHGGSSLADGTDCSGFTCFIYKDFGYSISRTPSGQYSNAGRSIEFSEIQPGDIICYSSNGKSCTHVALYIGDGQIIHAANKKKGVITSAADYSTIIGVRNVID